MITAIIIVVGFLLIGIINNRIVQNEMSMSKKNNTFYSNKKIKPKINLVIIIGFAFIVASVIFINFFYNQQDNTSISKDNNSETLNYEEKSLSSNQIFLKENGFNINANIKDSDIEILKDAIDKGIFNEKSFCEFYGEYKILEYSKKYKVADNVIEDFKKVENLQLLFASKGYELCPDALSKAISERDSKKTYLSVNINPCVISEDFIKQDLRYPKSADFSIFDCKSERKSDGSYTVLRKVSAKNALGVESEFIYKVNFGFIGGSEVDMNNWKLLSIQSEEYK